MERLKRRDQLTINNWCSKKNWSWWWGKYNYWASNTKKAYKKSWSNL